MESNQLKLINAFICRSAASLPDGTYYYVGVADSVEVPPDTAIRRLVVLEFRQPNEPGSGRFTLRMQAPDGNGDDVIDEPLRWDGHGGMKRIQAEVELGGDPNGRWMFIARINGNEVASLGLDMRPSAPEPALTAALTERFGGPFVQSALFCDRLLQEADSGTISLIRLIDQFTIPWLVPASAASDDEGFASANLQGTLLIGLKSGDLRGDHVVILEMRDPDGLMGRSRAYPITFEGGEQGLNLILPFDIRPSSAGVYWFSVLLEERVLTRVPIGVVYETIREQDARARSDTDESSLPSVPAGHSKRRREQTEAPERST